MTIFIVIIIIIIIYLIAKNNNSNNETVDDSLDYVWDESTDYFWKILEDYYHICNANAIVKITYKRNNEVNLLFTIWGKDFSSGENDLSQSIRIVHEIISEGGTPIDYPLHKYLFGDSYNPKSNFFNTDFADLQLSDQTVIMDYSESIKGNHSEDYVLSQILKEALKRFPNMKIKKENHMLYGEIID